MGATYNSKLLTLNARFSGNYQHVSVGMYPPFDYFEHRRACVIKQRQRDARFESLPDLYKGPLTSHQRSILDAPIASLVHDVHSGTLSARSSSGHGWPRGKPSGRRGLTG